MGMDVSASFNIYFELDKGLAVPSFDTVYQCSSITCKNSRPRNTLSGPFCNQCGSPIEEKQVEGEPKLPDCYELCREFFGNDGSELLTQHHEGLPANIWLYNYSLGDILDDIDDDVFLCGGVIDLSQIDSEIVIQSAQKDQRLADFIPKFCEKFGYSLDDAPIKIKFGLVVYFC